MLHIYPVLVAAAARDRRLSLTIGVFASAMIGLGWYVSPPGSGELNEAANRGLAVVVVWMTALLSILRLQASAALRAAERDALAIFNFAGVMLVALDREGRVTRVNPKACEILGLREREILAQDWFERFVPAQTRDELRTYFRRLLSGALRAEELEQRNLVLSSIGEERIIAWRSTLLRDDRGEIVGTLSSGTDVTELQRSAEALAQREAMLRAVVHTAVDGIVTIDALGKVLTANPAAEAMFGYGRDELNGRNVSCLMNDYDRRLHDEYIARYLRTGDARIIGIGREVEGRRKDGSAVPIDLAVSEFRHGDERRFVGILRDITERKRAEAALREHEALVELGHMAAVIAHEVKNPLAGIRGAMQVLARQRAKDEEVLEISREVLSRIDTLVASIDERLMFARSSEPRMRPVELSYLLDEVCGLLRKDPRFRNVTIETKVQDLSIDADEELLRGAFTNLLVNAAQAMRGNGSVTIEVRSEGQACEISFADSGPGIPKEIRHRVFERFFTTKSGGAGLGLAIVKQAVEAHGGTVSVECPPRGGSVFRIRLPLEQADGSRRHHSGRGESPNIG